MDLRHFKCVKDVHATPMTRGVYNAYRGWAMPVGEVAEEPGYLVVYNLGTPDHYESWSPKRIFDTGYVELPGHGMPEYQRRVMLEYNELRSKLDKLNPFIEGAVFAGLPDDERRDLIAQRDAMGEYAKHLHSRIAKFVA